MNTADSTLPPELEDYLQSMDPGEAQSLRNVWNAVASPLPQTDPVLADHTLTNIRNLRQVVAEASNSGAPRFRFLSSRPLWAVAASLIIGAISIALWLRPVSYMAHTGQRLSITLPDGSQITLNSGARLETPRRFGETRMVVLHGEAFFDVVKEDRPFQVETFNARVRVLGTRFHVRSWPEDLVNETLVNLESGRVSLSATGTAYDPVILNPGQQSRVVGTRSAPTPVDSVTFSSIVAWMDGGLVFRNQLLRVVLDDLERRYGLELTLEPSTLADKHVSMIVRHPPNLDVVIENLCRGYGLKYRAISNGYELYDATPQQ
jgi:ferric-dicitrate binding protein FerR (iron transport regulator)